MIQNLNDNSTNRSISVKTREDVAMFMQVVPGSHHWPSLEVMLNWIQHNRNLPNFADELITMIRQTQKQGYELKK